MFGQCQTMTINFPETQAFFTLCSYADLFIFLIYLTLYLPFCHFNNETSLGSDALLDQKVQFA